jgi:sec-independent protein translocase protein TatC
MAKTKTKPAGEMTFLQHLEALRWHLIRSALAVVLLGMVAFVSKAFIFDVLLFGPKSPDFITYTFFCAQTRAWGLPEMFCFDAMPFELLNTRMAGQFSIHLWVSMAAGLIAAFPYIVWEFWRFIAPGLHTHERSAGRWGIAVVSLLFFIGVLFGYYLIVPLSVQFLGTYSISGEVQNLIDLGSYISTVVSVTLACGLLFELPVIMYFLARIGLVTADFLRTYRKHAFVVNLVVAAIITPPDITSQILVAIPIAILYEVSIFIAARVERNQLKKQAA